jgi:hypothetical protein
MHTCDVNCFLASDLNHGAYRLCVALGGLAVSVAAVPLKDSGLRNPAVVVRFLERKNPFRIISFGGEIKPSAPCRKILRHVK